MGSISCIWCDIICETFSGNFKQEQCNKILARVIELWGQKYHSTGKHKILLNFFFKANPIRLCNVISIYGRCIYRETVGVVSSMDYMYMGTKTPICARQYISRLIMAEAHKISSDHMLTYIHIDSHGSNETVCYIYDHTGTREKYKEYIPHIDV